MKTRIIAAIALSIALTHAARADGNSTGKTARVSVTFDKLPLHFIENRGQMNAQVTHYVHGKDTAIYFTPGGVTVAIADTETNAPSHHGLKHGLTLNDPAKQHRQRWALKLDFVGANPHVQPVAQDPQPGVVSYFKGPRDQWKTGLKTHGKITYPDLWAGVDLIFSGNEGGLKYTYIVKPGADPVQIRVSCRGAGTVSINAQGQIDLSTPVGILYDEKPTAYQEINSQRVPVVIEYALDAVPNGGHGNHNVAKGYHFNIGAYDHSKPLIIDPVVLLYARSLDGNGFERGLGIAVDAVGYAYVCGPTTSTDFPVVAGPDLTKNGYEDVYVGKLNTNGTAFVYLGFIGGDGGQEAYAVAVDNAGAAYVCGAALSDETTFPVVVGPSLHFQGGTFFGSTGPDAFVAKVDPTGTNLVYCGYIGGEGDDTAENIAVDATGHAYVTGPTSSDEWTFPVVVGPDLTQNGMYDTYVAKIKSDGSGFDYCGFIGGAKDDAGVFRDEFGDVTVLTAGSIALDSAGSAYVASYTASDEKTFPTGSGFRGLRGFDKTYNGGAFDAFVAKVKPDGSGLVYATYLGGADFDGATGIGVDANGNAYVAGYTASGEATFPVVGGPDLHFHGGIPPSEDGDPATDAFVAKLNPTGTKLVYCGYIGGPDDDAAQMLRVDAGGTAYVIGWTASGPTNFPVVNGPGFILNGPFDAFVAKVKPNPTSPVPTNNFVYCGYIGGFGQDGGYDIGFDGEGNAYCIGDLFQISSIFSANAAFVAKVGVGSSVLARDDFDSGPAISALPFSDTFDISLATTAPDDPLFSPEIPFAQTVWYHYTPDRDMLLFVDACPSPRWIAFGVYTGARGALTEVVPPTVGLGGRLAVPVHAGVTYHFMIGSPCTENFFVGCGSLGGVTFSIREYVPEIPNDDFDSATVISSLPFAGQLNGSLATTALDDPITNGVPYIRTGWYKFTPTRDMQVAADFGCPGSGYQIIFFTGTRGALNQVAISSPVNWQLPVVAQLQAGVTYHIMVGYPELNCSFFCDFCRAFGSADFTLSENLPPGNDDFDHATIVTNLPFFETNDLTDASSAADDPDNFAYGLPNVWYAFTAAQDMAIEVDTLGSEKYTKVYAYAGKRGALTDAPPVDFTDLACSGNGGGQQVFFQATAGVTYYVLVAGYPDCPRPGSIHVAFREATGAAPINDDFNQATVIDRLPFTDSPSLFYSTASPDDPPSYGPGGVWYMFTPSRDMPVEVSATETVSHDLVGVSVDIYAGSRGALATVPADVPCREFSRKIFQARAGVTYYFLLKYGQHCPLPDPLVFTVQERTDFPRNDEFDQATQIAGLPFADDLNVLHATRAPGDKSLFPECEGMGERSVWYTFTPDRDMRVDVDTTGSDYDTAIWVGPASAIVDGTGLRACGRDCCGNTCYVAGQSNPACYQSYLVHPFTSRLRFDALASTNYFIMVGTSSRISCPTNTHLVLSVSETQPLINGTINPVAGLNRDGAVTVTGNLTCSRDLSGEMYVYVIQPAGCDLFPDFSCRYQFQVLTNFHCSAQANYVMTTQRLYFDKLEPGPATVILSGSFCDPDTCQPLRPTIASATVVIEPSPRRPFITAGSSALTREDCKPANGSIDPGEKVTVGLALKNIGNANASNLVATLLPTGGVTAPKGQGKYGILLAGGSSVTQSFTFIASGQCGQPITATLQFKDGTNDLGTTDFTFVLGKLGPVVTNVFSSGGIGEPISDFNITESSITVPDLGQIKDINVRLRLNHTLDSDLVISLSHSGGSFIFLAYAQGGSGENFGSGADDCSGTFTVFDDSAPTGLNDGTPPFAGSFRPDEPLSILKGEPSRGTWTLSVEDIAEGNDGTLFCWEIEFIHQDFVCCGTPLPVANVYIFAVDPKATEAGKDTGRFQVMRFGPTDAPLDVNYVVGGTATPGRDYHRLSGHVTIPAGQTTADIIVRPRDDTDPEPVETVIVTLESGSGYVLREPSTDTVYIRSDE